MPKSNSATKAKHKIRLKSDAAKEFEHLKKSQPKIAGQIQDKIDELKKNLFPQDYIKLTGCENTYRVESGEYRIIYEFNHGIVEVYIVRIAHRKNVYQQK